MTSKSLEDNSMANVLDSEIFESLDEQSRKKRKTKLSLDKNTKTKNHQAEPVTQNDANNNSILFGSTPYSNKILNQNNFNSSDFMVTPFFGKITSSVNRVLHLNSPARKNYDFLFNLTSSPSAPRCAAENKDIDNMPSFINKSVHLSDFLTVTPQKNLGGDFSYLNQNSIFKSLKKSASKLNLTKSIRDKPKDLATIDSNVDLLNDLNNGDDFDLYKHQGFSPFLRLGTTSSKKRNFSQIDSPVQTPMRNAKSRLGDDYITRVLMDFKTPKSLKKKIENYNLQDLDENIEEELRLLGNSTASRSTLSTSVSRREIENNTKDKENKSLNNNKPDSDKAPKEAKSIDPSMANFQFQNSHMFVQPPMGQYTIQQPIIEFANGLPPGPPALVPPGPPALVPPGPPALVPPGFQGLPYPIPMGGPVPPGFPLHVFPPVSIQGPYMAGAVPLHPNMGYPYMGQMIPHNIPTLSSSVDSSANSSRTPLKQQGSVTDSPSTILATSTKKNLTDSVLQKDYLASPTPDAAKHEKKNRLANTYIPSSAESVPMMGTFGKSNSTSKPLAPAKKQNKGTNFQFVFTDVKSLSSYNQRKSMTKKKSNIFKRSASVSTFSSNKENLDPSNFQSDHSLSGRIQREKGSTNALTEVKSANVVANNDPQAMSKGIHPQKAQFHNKTIIRTTSVPDYYRDISN